MKNAVFTRDLFLLCLITLSMVAPWNRGEAADASAAAQVVASAVTQSIARHAEEKIEPAGNENDSSQPQKVTVGFYLLSGGKLDFVTSSLSLDFYIWLTFPGSTTPQFEFLNSKNVQVSKQDEEIPYHGTDLGYQVFRVTGTFDQDFDLKNYPFDRFTVKIFFEDTEKEISERLYVPDVKESGIDPMFHILGWEVENFTLEAPVHTYGTTFGTPLKTEKEVYSQIKFNLSLNRDHEIIFIKMVTPAVLFLCIAVLGVVLPIEQLSQRISLSVAGLFSSVAYHLSLSQGLPPISYLTFADKMMLGNYGTIFLNLLFTISIYLAGKYGYERTQYVLTRSSWLIMPLVAFSIIFWLIIHGFYS